MTLFEALNSIELDKKPWNELTDDFKKVYSQFMFNRFISSKKQYLPLIAKLSTMKLSDEQHYNVLCSLLDRQLHYFNYKAYKQKDKSIDDLTLYAVQHEFDVGLKDAQRYADILSIADLKVLCDKWRNHYNTYK